MIMIYGVIYKAVNKINNKIYIGQTTKSLKSRIYQHKSDAINRNYNNKFHNALFKYGIENFKWEIIDSANSRAVLDVLESGYIKKYHTCRDGYNSNSGGHGIRDFSGSRNGMFGKKHSKETRSKIGLANSGPQSFWFGKKHSEETKRKIGEAQIGEKNHMYGRIGKDNHSFGKVLSKATKVKIGKANSQLWEVCFPDGTRKVIKNLRKFCREHDILYDNGMLYVAKGIYKQYKGFKCKKLFYEEIICQKV